MSTELELDAGIAKFTADLSELVTAMKGLVDSAIGVNEKEQARAAMKALIDESRKAFETIVQVLASLYTVTDESNFTKEFANRLAEFKALYANKTALARTHCSIVEEEFNKLRGRRSWMTYLPLAQNSYERLESVCGRWLFQDWKIVADIESFFGLLNRFLLKIADLNRTDPKQGFQAFFEGWKLIEQDFLAMQTRLGELEALSRRL
jgi:hypothetical protein